MGSPRTRLGGFHWICAKFSLSITDNSTRYGRLRLFCAAPYSDDARYSPGGDESRERKRLSPKDTSVESKYASLRSRAD